MSRRVLWVAPAVSAVLLVATLSLRVAYDLRTDKLIAEVLPNVVLAMSLPLLGAAVLSTVPGHRLGRLWLVCGVAAALTVTVHSYAEVAATGDLPLGTAAGWVAAWLWVLGFTPLITLGLLLFPDGRVPSPRWRPLLAVAAAAVALPVVGQALAPGELEGLGVSNPLGIEAARSGLEVASSIGFVCFTIGAIGGAAAMVGRWLQGDARSRQQLALPAFAASLLGATFLVPTVKPLTPWLDVAATAEVTLLLASFGVAVLRDRITGAQVAVRRSLTYGFLTGSLTLAYAAVVAVLSHLVDGGADLLAALAVALLALPLRDRLHRLVDRSLYGERTDPFTVLEALEQRLDGAADPEAVLTGVAESVATALRLPSVRVLLREDGAEAVAAAVGDDVAAWTRLPLRDRGSEVGALLVAPRSGQSALDPRDLRMLDALLRQAGAAVAAVRLTRELQRSRQRLVEAREEERRRLRRDLHDGLGPTLAGIGLGLEVARGSADPQQVQQLLADLKDEAAAAVVDVRRLVEDLRPPALDELGLVGALRRHADRLSVGEGTTVVVEAPLEGWAGLPAAVEVAGYRIAMEALTNAVRHGRPSRCALTLSVDDALHIAVTDDGTGLPDRPREGVGLGAMRDRARELGGTCTIERVAVGGTAVVAQLPLQGS